MFMGLSPCARQALNPARSVTNGLEAVKQLGGSGQVPFLLAERAR